ncbi:GNAT family N-acetyltransferase [Fulvimarina sp. 2208YS6-2-32]|uniref:GNAT family N-acetyltransferase n=1 Tax=Fulvimarina uroteuthidis TaxID=3098149 RepID=A0ABU5HYQ8_9HYPH|nr:GNAT family N-acetyltransferase [Fulvimarina sp. 2208YS6-2-32]MDY8107693.1 GNAT family N-acetyltransferase [Fulvimarina sp. 2208YS6-2-32]
MTTTLTDIRYARETDALCLNRIHAASWRQAYTGIIPFRSLHAMIGLRDAGWWSRTVKSGAAILVCSFGGTIVGYATLGQNRTRSLPVDGELYELYLDPTFQGVGLGRRLFNAARDCLLRDGARGFAIWTLAENDRAVAFYTSLGGTDVAEGIETFGGKTVSKVAFLWT